MILARTYIVLLDCESLEMLWNKVHNETSAYDRSNNYGRNYYPFFGSLSSSYRLIDHFIINISAIVILFQSVPSPSYYVFNIGNWQL